MPKTKLIQDIDDLGILLSHWAGSIFAYSSRNKIFPNIVFIQAQS